MSSTAAAVPCFVHDRRWLPTYQFLLNQLYEKISLPRKDGRRFSNLVCACDGTAPRFQEYFGGLRGLEDSYNDVHKTLQGWSEAKIVIDPVTRKLEDRLDADVQLMKFVYYFKKCKDGAFDCLALDHKLPGPDQHLPPTATDLPAQSTPGDFSGIEQQKPSSSRFQPKKIPKEDRKDSCEFHGEKKRYLFQCVLNGLLKRNQFPAHFREAMSQLVCTCDRTPEQVDYYKSQEELEEDLKAFLTWLDPTRSESMNALKALHRQIQACMLDKVVPRDLVPLVYYFRKAEQKNYTDFNEMREELKKKNCKNDPPKMGKGRWRRF